MKAGEFLNSNIAIEDCPSPREVTIVGYEGKELENPRGSKDMVLFLKLAEFNKTFRCNKTNIKRLVSLFGEEDIDRWMGQRFTLFSDPTMAFRDKPAGLGVMLTAPSPSIAAQSVAQAVGGTVVGQPQQPQPQPPSDVNGYKDF